MSKRKLNRRQTWRTEKIQEERAKRAEKKQRNLSSQQQSGDLSSEQKGLVICRFSSHYEVEALEGDDKGKIHQCVSRANIKSLVAGDQIVWCAGSDLTGVIESRLPRENLLERPDNFGKLKPVAANIDQILIVVACEPAPQPNLIDRYLVAAELMEIDPIIVLNKADLLDEYNTEIIQSTLDIYRELDYPVIQIACSRHQEAQLNDLPEHINNKTSIVVGQSGVGKSSLINKLLPDAQLRVGGLSELTREGTHTTSMAKLFHLPDGGQLIDSPGIRDFSLWHINHQQLQQGFREIAALLGHCKFRDCKHETEPGCAIIAAAEEYLIDPERFESYERIKLAIEEQQARGLSLEESH